MTGEARLTRKQQAEASRRRVLEAARASFIESGYHGATMADIAERSGFAVQTVSYFFGTKPKVLSQLIVTTIDEAIRHGAERQGHLAWDRDEPGVTSGEELIDAFVDVGHDILMVAAPLMDVARVGALVDSEVAEVYAFHEQWRHRDYARFARWLGELGALREGLGVERATDITLTVFGPEVYLALGTARGWSGDEIRDAMRDTLRRLLLA
ncbi:hypothetical protein GCM10025789_17720 [Tessaracoccus lubricantis]|uniref:HTH tetR-type domain-containing protein n=1 Tax=Tessaracoccus lubricantis TaxID=545543 RepID=A0ABP9FK84_9ACTN